MKTIVVVVSAIIVSSVTITPGNFKEITVMVEEAHGKVVVAVTIEVVVATTAAATIGMHPTTVAAVAITETTNLEEIKSVFSE